ncbi:hypothetical protein M2323_004302 [Rhodoblastus acidophilus]|uniref:hypothetical protein n=1 Tax=Rhodoblastus acidophilus TaxID=1074 RepID=UPI0022252403|nr:hypothetical protein [Rhodoblastus acidophilus]MCW2286505.1 hypothetical protein [Rhodoblastus acidophilus]MCW2335354.1 hypothetical protein [Rhodoblastus acidophilus]
MSPDVLAGEVRSAVPQSYLEDAFLKSLRASKALAEIGVTVSPLSKDDSSAAQAAVTSGAAEPA